MEVIHARNVNHAYYEGLRLLSRTGQPETSRAGQVLVSPCPVTTVYDRPTERVLFDESRDANPFFHLFESIWMLAGRSDTKFLDKFIKDFGARFAEPGPDARMWGAYGNRWRNHFDIDQLDVVVRRLQRDPRDRRVVVSMWDPITDLIGPDDVDPETMESIWTEGSHEPRDLPCNTHLYLRVREGDTIIDDRPVYDDVLDLTVYCRSNDIIFGAYGANAVHFSVLLEYLAARLGCQVGKMYQVSNNWHGYTEVLGRVAPPSSTPTFTDPYTVAYIGTRVRPMPMVTHPLQFLKDCERFCDWVMSRNVPVYANEWFAMVAEPMFTAHRLWREGDMVGALRATDRIAASDWRLAVQRWLDRRASKGGA